MSKKHSFQRLLAFSISFWFFQIFSSAFKKNGLLSRFRYAYDWELGWYDMSLDFTNKSLVEGT